MPICEFGAHALLMLYLMLLARTGDGTLRADDAKNVLNELMGAKNKSYALGLELKLPQRTVKAIHTTYSRPDNRLLQVLFEFMKQTDPRPTWRVITDALRSPAVNLPRLAKKVEAAHFPDPTSTRDVVSETRPVIVPTGIRFYVHLLL